MILQGPIESIESLEESKDMLQSVPSVSNETDSDFTSPKPKKRQPVLNSF